MSNEETKHKIENALKAFASGNMNSNATKLFGTLGYTSGKRLQKASFTPDEFLASYNTNVERPLNTNNALVKDWKQVHFLFQLTAEEIKHSAQMGFVFDAKNRVDNTIIESYLFFALELAPREYTRTELSVITREINKIFPQPVMILFSHGKTLTLSIIDRRLNKVDENKDVLQKVTLIKDISIVTPHRAHVEILFDLSLDELQKQFGFTNFVELHRAWQKALDSSELNTKFFKELSNWYFWALQNVTFPEGAGNDEDVRNATSVIRLITRLIFIWFIKEKNLVPEALFNQNKLKGILKNSDPEATTYYKAILQNLFFATLNQEMNTPEKPNNRQFRGKSKQPNGRDQHYGITNLYRYEDYFQQPAVALKLFDKVPFLNGGLFECLDKPDKEDQNKIIRIDGFSDHKDNAICVPNFLFFSNEQDIDLNEVYDTKNKTYKVRGLIDLLDRYKFTINENTPIEEEVALDPELLGKVFENLLASYNPETQTTARKSTGSYYTPREIVNYMVDESLIACLTTILKQKLPELAKTNGLNEILREVFSYSEYKGNDHYFNKTESTALIEAIDNVKVLDPACGSGAFPMGILHKLVFILNKLDPHNEMWKERQIFTAKKIEEIDARELAVQSIEDSFTRNELDYARKLYLIQNCIYGVDIQPIAVQIAKLRFFISLVVDQQLDEALDNRGILPLPNLETKFVAANTLIELDKPKLNQKLSLRSPAVIQKEQDLANIRKDYFAAKTPAKKRKCRETDSKLRAELAELLKDDGFPGKTAKILAHWDPYDQNIHADWFDPEWMFGVTGGFDIVIGNPPYVQLQKDSGKLANLYENSGYKSFERSGDIYALFYERGINLLQNGGHLCFITSNKWMRTGYGESLRDYFITKNPQLLIDLGPGIFENATVDTNILIIQNAPNSNHLFGLTLTIEAKDHDLAEFIDKHQMKLPQMTKNAWFIGNDAEHKLKNKIEKAGKQLKDWNVSIYFGIKTGLNEAFIIDTEIKEKLCKEDPKSKDVLKPILRGRDVDRYIYEWAGLYIIATFPSLNVDINKYPAVKQYLLSFGKEKLEQTGKTYQDGSKSRKLTGHSWFETQDPIAYHEEFKKEKVIWKRIGSILRFAYTDNVICCQDSTCIMTGEHLKYLCGYMNSTLGRKLLFDKAPKTGTGDLIVSVQALEPLLVPSVTDKNKPMVHEIELLVAQIIADKTKNPKANTNSLEARIDELVYQLYELTPEEIAIVEGKK
jgi:hypothetical protein